MFNVGDYVVKSNKGICRIDKISELDLSLNEKNRKYFFLTPINEMNTKIYVPVDKEDNGIRKVITESEAWELIKKIPNIKASDIKDDKQREQKYKDVIKSNDLNELIAIIKNMYNRKQSRISVGKKNTSVDEHFFRVAEDNLYSELAFAIGKNKEDMKNIIEQNIAVNEF